MTPLDGGLQSLTLSRVDSDETLWFDRIEYIPSKQASLEQEVIRVDVNDPKVDTWTVSTSITSQNAFVRFPFYGKL